MADDPNQVLIVVAAQDKSGPVLDAAAQRLRSLNEQGAESTVAASAEEAASLALVEAQYGVTAEAAATALQVIAEGELAAAASAGELAVSVVASSVAQAQARYEGAAAAAGSAAVAIEADSAVAAAAASTAAIVVAASDEEAQALAAAAAAEASLAAAAAAAAAAVEPAMQRAGAAVSGFEAVAGESVRGAKNALTTAIAATRQLEVEIERLRDAGLPTAALEADLARLRQRMDDAAATAGRFRAAQKEANDVLKDATRATGEFRGQLGSLDDIARSISPGLAGFALKLTSLEIGLSLIHQLVSELSKSSVELASSLGADKDRAEAFGKSLEDHFSANPAKFFSAIIHDIKDGIPDAVEQAASALELLARHEEGAGNEAALLGDRARELVREGIDPVGKSAEQLAAIYDDLARRGKLSFQVQRGEIEKFREAIEGDATSVEKLSKADLLAAQSIIANGHLTRAEAEELGKRLDANAERLARVGKSSALIDELRDALASMAQTAQRSESPLEKINRELASVGVASTSSIDDAASALLTFAGAAEKAGDTTASSARTIVAAAKKVEAQILSLPLAERAQYDVLLAQARSFQARYADVLADVGAKSATAIDDMILKLGRYIAAVAQGGSVTGEQGELIRTQIEKIRKEISELPVAQRKAAEEQLASLERIQEGFRKTADVILASFGIEAPDAIRRSTTELNDLVVAFGPLGKVTKEQAEKVVAEAKKILESIALLPAAERKAVADQVGELRRLVSVYSEVAVKKKAFYVDVEEYEKKAAEGVKQFVEQSISLYGQLINELKAVDAAKAAQAKSDRAAQEKELDDLRNTTGPLSGDQETRLNELTDTLGRTSDGTNTLSKSIGLLGDQNKAANLSIEKVNTAVDAQLKLFENNTAAYHKLGAAGQEEFANLVTGLQRAQEEGTATSDFLEGQLSKVKQLASDAGVSNEELSKSFAGVGDQSSSLNSRLASLDQSSSRLSDSLDGLSGSSGDVASSQGKLQDSMEKTNEVFIKLEKDGRKAILTLSRGLAGVATKAGDVIVKAEGARKALTNLGNVTF